MIKKHDRKTTILLTSLKTIVKHKLKELKTKVSFSQMIQQQTMCVFVMLKSLRDEIAAFLHSPLPDPLGERSFIFYSVQYEKYEI